MEDLQKEYDIQEGRYKLLTSSNYREIVSNRLKIDWIRNGLINNATKITYGLVAGNIYQNKEAEINDLYFEKRWLFWGPSIIKSKIEELMEKGYENSAVTVISKILLR